MLRKAILSDTKSALCREVKLLRFQSAGFSFGKWNLRKVRKEIFSPRMLDLTKSGRLVKQADQKAESIKSKFPKPPFSKLLKAQPFRRDLLKLNPYINPNRHQLQKSIRKANIKMISHAEETQTKKFQYYFRLDQTAQSLENIRKMKENQIFNRKQKQLKEVARGIKDESMKYINYLPDYGQFMNFEPFSNTAGLSKSNKFSIVDFNPHARLKIGASLEERNPLFKEKENFGSAVTEYSKYLDNRQKMDNLRISSLLEAKKENRFIGRLLGNEDGSKQDIVALDEPSMEMLDQQVLLSEATDRYEKSAREKYRELDLYERYSGRPEFRDLSVKEQMNYIKFNVRNSKELFGMLKELDDSADPVVLNSFLHKIALGVKENKDREKLLNVIMYKKLLLRIKPSIGELPTKALIDSLYSLGRIHGEDRKFSYLFFQHLVHDFLVETQRRLLDDSINSIELSYLCEALNLLKLGKSNEEPFLAEAFEDLKLRIFDSIQTKQFVITDINHLTKILSFLYFNSSDCSDKLLGCLSQIGSPLLDYIKDSSNEITQESSNRDFSIIVNTYSYGYFLERQTKGTDTPKAKASKSIYRQSNKALSAQSRKSPLFREILQSMKRAVIHKSRDFSLLDCGFIIQGYSLVELYPSDLFSALTKQVLNCIDDMEFSRNSILGLTMFNFGFSKSLTLAEFPQHGLQSLNVVYPIRRRRQVSNRNFEVLKRLGAAPVDYQGLEETLPRLAYYASLMGYSDMKFHGGLLNAIVLKSREDKSFVRDLGYVFQAMALNGSKHHDYFYYFVNVFLDRHSEILDLCEVNKSTLPLTQVLSALTEMNYLQFDPYCESFRLENRLEAIKPKEDIYRQIQSLDKSLVRFFKANRTNVNDPRANQFAVSLLWFLSYNLIIGRQLGFEASGEIDLGFISDGLKYINQSTLTKYEAIVFEIVRNLIVSEQIELDIQLTTALKLFEHERSEIQKANAVEYNYLKPLADLVREYLTNQALNLRGAKAMLDHIVLDSYTVPVFFPDLKLGLLFYDGADVYDDQTVSGYQACKEYVLAKQGIRLEKLVDSPELRERLDIVDQRRVGELIEGVISKYL